MRCKIGTRRVNTVNDKENIHSLQRALEASQTLFRIASRTDVRWSGRHKSNMQNGIYQSSHVPNKTLDKTKEIEILLLRAKKIVYHFTSSSGCPMANTQYSK